ncbi:MAG TPA: phosphomannomutase/phosphoglucomutase [Terriglobales bacterium]|nr:phosphomannomutase/phosphoglucomutase [Terriglobales bacterium]
MLNPHIFRAYDVRGLVGADINPPVFEHVGRAYATLIRRRGGRRIAVGQDNRTSSHELKAAFVAGVRAAGADVVDIGLVTTPILYFATAHWRLDGGANITGSHNPVEYNGVKMVHPGAAPLSEDEIQWLRTAIESGDLERGAGRIETRSPREDYLQTVSALVRPARRLKVVVDAGNGVAGLYAPELLRRIGCEVTELYCESDGSFPNHLPDPEDAANVVDLQKKVLELRADLGVAYDGDADRVGIIDEQGRRHEADLILVLLARDLLTRHPGAKIVFDVKSSQSLVDDIRKHGGVPVMWKTGHSHLKRKMRDDGILLGGEVSGHMFFAENYYGVDDGLLASCKLIDIASRHAGTVSSLFDSMEHLHATPELKAMCPDGEKFRVVEELVRELKRRYDTVDIDGARVNFPGGGWGLVRASNTNPYLTLRFEARSEAEIAAMKRELYGALQRYPFVTLPTE